MNDRNKINLINSAMIALIHIDFNLFKEHIDKLPPEAILQEKFSISTNQTIYHPSLWHKAFIQHAGPKFIEFLINNLQQKNYNFDINLPTNHWAPFNGFSAYHISLVRSNFEIMSLLVNYGANPNALVNNQCSKPAYGAYEIINDYLDKKIVNIVKKQLEIDKAIYLNNLISKNINQNKESNKIKRII